MKKKRSFIVYLSGTNKRVSGEEEEEEEVYSFWKTPLFKKINKTNLFPCLIDQQAEAGNRNIRACETFKHSNLLDISFISDNSFSPKPAGNKSINIWNKCESENQQTHRRHAWKPRNMTEAAQKVTTRLSRETWGSCRFLSSGWQCEGESVQRPQLQKIWLHVTSMLRF